jgi:poly(A) polymerase
MPPAAPPDLAPQPWMTAPETRSVIAALVKDGGTARFVGGCVRDALVGRPVKDIDIATPDPPERVMERLGAAGIRVIPTGIDHGTVTAVIGPRHFEITTLRRDVEPLGRRARVAFTDDWAADAARRDFTINALSADPDGTVHDPFGGLADLNAGRVRFVGEPETRIREDVLRLLRFFRFQAYYGKGAPDEAGLAACRRLAHLLPTLSGERVAGEILRLMLGPDSPEIVQLMMSEGVLPHILPELRDLNRLRAMVRLEERHAAPDALRRLASLLPRDPAGAAALAERLRLSNAEAERLAALAAPPIEVSPLMDARARRRALYHLGADRLRDLALMDAAGRDSDAGLARLLADAASWVPPRLPIKGQDALDLGLAPGKRVGELVAAVERWWEEGDFRADRAACLAYLKQIAGAK